MSENPWPSRNSWRRPGNWDCIGCSSIRPYLPSDSMAAQKTLRVLNIEDSQRDAALLQRHLSRAGYEVILERVDTPAAMKAALEAKEWDVVLADYTMPEFSALKALALLQETGLDIPFIIISGTIGEELAVEAMLAGASDYVMKENL